MRSALAGIKRPRREKQMKHLRAIALIALMALPTMVVPAFGQQETDPTWYDPWAPVLVKPATPAQTQAPVAKKETKATNTNVAQHKIRKSVHDQAPRRQPEPTEAMLSTK
jgi:hypothetical protein